MKQHEFIPAYYEWHFIDTENPKQVLLNWVDPIDDLYIYQDKDGNDLKEPLPMTYEQVLRKCECFINMAQSNIENDTHGNKKELLDLLPSNAADIMATALYDYYIA